MFLLMDLFTSLALTLIRNSIMLPAIHLHLMRDNSILKALQFKTEAATAISINSLSHSPLNSLLPSPLTLALAFSSYPAFAFDYELPLKCTNEIVYRIKMRLKSLN
jgi:hypothetical protein